jgi:hypothetical protein
MEENKVKGVPWEMHQEWERKWWDTCSNTFGEKFKQLIYFAKMGLFYEMDPNGNSLWLQVKNLSICDIGGGPDSALLQTRTIKGTVIDPCDYPQWTKDRYASAGINLIQISGEDINTSDPNMRFDECWIYNCLQHTKDPDKIAKNALAISRLVRVFEPINYPPTPGHPHMLTKEWLDRIFEGNGTEEEINQNGFMGNGWYGCFRGKL